MIVEVEAGGFVEAVDAFRAGNLAAASTHDTLSGRLVATAGMAGDDASGADFASAYDETARETLAAMAEVATAFATLGRLTGTSWDNHRRAEERSILPGGVVTSSCRPPPEASYAAVLPTSLPSSLGGDPPALTPQQAWVLDHLEGFVWPDADVERLREAARSWRAAGESLDDAATWCGVAASALQSQRSPEVPLAVAAADDLRTTVRELASASLRLAGQCDAYADAVEARHAEIRALVQEVLQLVVEGVVIGAVLAGLTAGAGAAVGMGSVAARVASQSPRFAAVLAALRGTTAGIAGSLRSTRAAVTVQRARLERYLRIPARTEAGHLVLGSARWRPGWLARHEHSGGHTIGKHIGRTREELRVRLHRDGIPRASSFTSQAEAERILASTLRAKSRDIERWLDSGRAQLRLDHWTGTPTGVSVTAHGDDVVNGVRLVLRRDARMPEGFRIHTAFPHP